MQTNVRLKSEQIKKHLIEQFGDEIKNQIFNVWRYTSFEELGRVKDELYNYREFKYNLTVGIDDGDPYFSLSNLNLSQLIDIIKMDYSYGICVDVKNDTQDKFDLLNEVLTELI